MGGGASKKASIQTKMLEAATNFEELCKDATADDVSHMVMAMKPETRAKFLEAVKIVDGNTVKLMETLLSASVTSASVEADMKESLPDKAKTFLGSEEFTSNIEFNFTDADTDGSGFLTGQQLADAVKEMHGGLPLSLSKLLAHNIKAENIDSLVKAFDANSNGKMDKAEFMKFMTWIFVRIVHSDYGQKVLDDMPDISHSEHKPKPGKEEEEQPGSAPVQMSKEENCAPAQKSEDAVECSAPQADKSAAVVVEVSLAEAQVVECAPTQKSADAVECASPQPDKSAAAAAELSLAEAQPVTVAVEMPTAEPLPPTEMSVAVEVSAEAA